MPQPLNVLGGLDDAAAYKVTCAVATTVAIDNTMIGLPIIDGYQTKLGDRILVWQNTDQTLNGIWWIPGQVPLPIGPQPVSTGAWVRALDFTNTDSVYQGTQVLVYNGATYAGMVFVVTSPTGPLFGSTPITFSPSQTGTAAATAAAQASASAAAASASAAAAAAAAAGTGGVASLAITGGTLVLTPSQSNAAILSLTGSLTANQFIDFPAGTTNPKMAVLQGATTNGFSVYLRGNGGSDVIGVWYSSIWMPPTSIIITPTRVYWGGYETMAPGTYEEYPVGSSIPPGRLICDGASYSAALYDLLFGVIGTTFGGSGGSFNVPDDRGYAHAAADNLGTAAGSAGRLNNWAVEQVGGESTHLLTIPEMPTHNHSAAGGGSNVPGGSGALFTPVTTGVTGSTGGNSPHNNIQPTRTTMRTIRF